jgi:protein TonB
MFNNSSNLYGSEWLALVFSNRNKKYGAYELRSQSSNILVKSLFIVVPVFVFLFVGPMIYAEFNKQQDLPIERELPVTMVEQIHELKKIEKKEEIKKAAPIKQEQVKTVKVASVIKVVEDKLVNTPPPTTAQIENAVIASTTQDGVEGMGNALPNLGTTSGGGGEGAEGVSDNLVHNVAGVEVYPEFPGGMAAWAKFIQKNLRYPYMAQDANIQGKVYLSFVVEKDGSITDVNVIRGIGAGCDEEAMRVIKKSPKWKAGEQNNQKVRVRYTMPINYTITQ